MSLWVGRELPAAGTIECPGCLKLVARRTEWRIVPAEIEPCSLRTRRNGAAGGCGCMCRGSVRRTAASLQRLARRLDGPSRTIALSDDRVPASGHSYNTISSFGVAKVNFLSERTLSCIDSDNAREETRRWRS